MARAAPSLPALPATDPSAGKFLRTILCILCCINSLFLAGGVLFGWAALEVVLSAEGVFPNSTNAERAAALQRMPTLAYTCLTAAACICGLTLNSLGPRILATFGNVLVASGNLIFAFSSDAHLYKWALCLIALGATCTYLCGFGLALLFPGREQVFISICCAALFTASGLNYLVLKYLYFHFGLSLHTFFLAYGLLAACAALGCWVCYPVRAYKSGQTATWPPLCSLGRRFRQSGPAVPSLLLPEVSENYRTPCRCGFGAPHRLGDCSLLRQLCSPRFLWLLLWYPLSLLVMSFYNSTITTQLSLKDAQPLCALTSNAPNLCTSGFYPTAPNASTAAAAGCVQCAYVSYTSTFEYFSNFSFILNIPAGFLLTSCGFAPILALSLLSTQLSLAVLLLPGLPIQLLSFAFFALMRALLFSVYYGYIARTFPIDHYGSFIAVADATSTAVSLLQYPMHALVTSSLCRGSFAAVNVAQVGALLLGYGLPLTLLCDTKAIRLLPRSLSSVMQRMPSRTHSLAPWRRRWRGGGDGDGGSSSDSISGHRGTAAAVSVAGGSLGSTPHQDGQRRRRASSTWRWLRLPSTAGDYELDEDSSEAAEAKEDAEAEAGLFGMSTPTPPLRRHLVSAAGGGGEFGTSSSTSTDGSGAATTRAPGFRSSSVGGVTPDYSELRCDSL